MFLHTILLLKERKGEVKMFEFTYSDHDLLESYINCDRAYFGGKYDFTFENRYIIYHIKTTNKTRYVSIDKHTGKSEVLTTVMNTEKFTKENATKLIPYILEAVKKTRSFNYIQEMIDNPYGVIDIIFRTVLPNYGYNIREEQISLSKTMYKGLTEKQIAICEAEVGTGKTLAYLVASTIARIVYKKKYHTDMPVTISTSSVELQKSLMEKEIPSLSRMLLAYGIIPKEIKTILRKGKEHYLCPLRFEDYKRNISKYRDNYTMTLSAMKGIKDLDVLVDLDKYDMSTYVKHRICVKGSCSGCGQKNECPYIMFKEYALECVGVDFQIVNHNLYLAAQKVKAISKKNILKESCFVIVDEAHKLKEAAEATFSETLTEEDIPEYINVVKTLCAKVVDIPYYKQELFRALRLNTELFQLARRIHRPKDVDADSGSAIKVNGRLAKCLDELIDCISIIEELKKRTAHHLPLANGNLRAVFKTILNDKSNIVWVNTDENGSYIISSVPRDVTQQIKDLVWDRNVSHVLTSGTLSDGKDFEYFKSENGLKGIEKRLLLETRVESPFDYKHNARLYLPKGIPTPDNNNELYVSAIANEIYKIIEATNGHTAILFTSYRLLEFVYKMLEGKLAKYSLFKMTRGVNNVITDFKKSENGILFASGSMWEGVDCVGDRLSSVIIVRLPFPVRTVQMEEKKYDCRTVSDFVGRYCIPNMIIKLRQGAGRLLRSETDTGVVSILDSRAMSSSYANKVERAMSKYPIIKCIDDLAYFMKNVKDKDYFS